MVKKKQKMQRKIIIYIAILFYSSIGLNAQQEILTLEQAIDIALKNNYGIEAAKVTEEIAQNNIYKGSVGYYPSVNVTGSYNYSNKNTDLTILQGPGQELEIEQDGATSTNFNIGLGANYLIFDGFARRYNFEKLKLSGDQTSIQTRQLIENILLQIINNFFEVCRLSEQTTIEQENITNSKDKLERAQTRFDLGSGSKLEILNLEVNINNDSLNIINNEISLDNAKRNLNLTLGRELNTEFTAIPPTATFTEWNIEQLWTETKKNNPAFEQNNTNLLLKDLDIKLAKAAQYPTLSANASYSWAGNDNDASQLLRSRNLGLNAGLSLNFNIFNGSRVKKSIENAQLARKQVQAQQTETEQNLRLTLENAHAQYKNSLYILKVQQKNLQTVEENYNRTEELLNYGKATMTQYREAQLNLVQSQLRINQAKYNAKRTEMELLRISGQLIK